MEQQLSRTASRVLTARLVAAVAELLSLGCLGCFTHNAMSSHIKVLATTSWLSLFLCAAVLLYLAISAPNTVLESTVEGRDESVRKTESSTDLRYVQQRAIELVQLGWVTSQQSLLLCRLVIGTLFLVMVGASISLVQIRRLKRQLSETTRAA
jgi:hypothetical protein